MFRFYLYTLNQSFSFLHTTLYMMTSHHPYYFVLLFTFWCHYLRQWYQWVCLVLGPWTSGPKPSRHPVFMLTPLTAKNWDHQIAPPLTTLIDIHSFKTNVLYSFIHHSSSFNVLFFSIFFWRLDGLWVWTKVIATIYK